MRHSVDDIGGEMILDTEDRPLHPFEISQLRFRFRSRLGLQPTLGRHSTDNGGSPTVDEDGSSDNVGRSCLDHLPNSALLAEVPISSISDVLIWATSQPFNFNPLVYACDLVNSLRRTTPH